MRASRANKGNIKAVNPFIIVVYPRLPAHASYQRYPAPSARQSNPPLMRRGVMHHERTQDSLLYLSPNAQTLPRAVQSRTPGASTAAPPTSRAESPKGTPIPTALPFRHNRYCQWTRHSLSFHSWQVAAPEGIPFCTIAQSQKRERHLLQSVLCLPCSYGLRRIEHQVSWDVILKSTRE